MPKRKLKGSASCSRRSKVFEGTDFCYPSSQIALSDLPDEILQKVCEVLDPQSLLAISNLNIRRLNNLFSNFRSADFSVCNTIGSQDFQSYFTSERVKHLKELNFNNVFFIQPSVLAACIGKCKSITKLHVFNCGLSFAHMITIFANCTHLEDLYWSIKDENCNTVKRLKTKLVKSIQKLSLQVNVKGSSFLISSKLIDICPNVKEFIVNFSPCYVTSLPATSATRHFSMQLKLRDNTIPPLSIVLQCDAERFPFKMLHFVECISELKEKEINEYFVMDGVNVPYYYTYHTSFLQFFDKNEYLTQLPSLPDESVKSLVMILNQNVEIVSYLERIKRMTGSALRHLSLYKLMDDDDDDIDVDLSYVRALLTGVVSNSFNITVLDLSELHMTFVFPFSVICNLKKLKVFNVSTCCFVLRQETKYTVMDCLNSFQNFVKKCNKVETFCIYDCKAGCKSPPMNDMLVPVSKWAELKCLVVQNVKALRECQFLIPIADSCHKLQFLEFIAVGEPKVCLFMSNMKHILMKAKELKFLRINHTGLYPMDPLLWNNIESAQKLQGLCLATKLQSSIVNKTILDAVNKLPYLHLFHLLAKRSCENLAQLVKREMTGNGVKFPDVKTTLNAYYESYEECACRHFPIE